MRIVNFTIFSYICGDEEQSVKIACDELNDEQGFIRFNFLKSRKTNIAGKPMELSEFYKTVSYPIKEISGAENLITVTDVATYTNEIKNSVSTHFSKSYRLGIVHLHEENTIVFLKYELLKQTIQISLQKYLEHSSEGCFFDRKTVLENVTLCEHCEKAIIKEGFTYEQLNELKSILNIIKRTKSGISDSNLFAVIILDIVSYSQYTDTEQKLLIKKLQKIIKNQAAIRKNRDKTIFLPTGDGCVIALSDYCSRDCVHIVCDLQKEIRSQDLHVRFGLNFGMIFRYRDINQQINIAGSGINMAARVMDLGDANHIIANRSIADNLGNLDNWHKSIFYPLGTVSVKHGVELEVFNIYSENEGFGNKKIPQKLRSNYDR